MSLPRIDSNSPYKPVFDKCLEFLLGAYGVEFTPEIDEHFSVMMEAMFLYHQRSQQYGELWKDSGAVEEFFNAYRKSRRVYNAVSQTDTVRDSDLDDALDAINYLIFGIRNARAGWLIERELTRE